ncbi:MAG: hypothetical protein ABI681_11560, partial [Gemmatimonadales bacterium]
MTAHQVSSYSASKGRRFALTVALAFAVLAAVSYWPGRDTLPLVLGALAAILAIAAVVAPARLEPV